MSNVLQFPSKDEQNALFVGQVIDNILQVLTADQFFELAVETTFILSLLTNDEKVNKIVHESCSDTTRMILLKCKELLNSGAQEEPNGTDQEVGNPPRNCLDAGPRLVYSSWLSRSRKTPKELISKD